MTDITIHEQMLAFKPADYSTLKSPVKYGTAPLTGSPLFPDLAEFYDYFNRLVHITGRYPLVARMEVVLAGKDIGCR